MQKWEYMYIGAARNNVITMNGEDHVLGKNSLPGFLNVAGEEGWDLVGVTLQDPPGGLIVSPVNGYFWRLIFKRPKG